MTHCARCNVERSLTVGLYRDGNGRWLCMRCLNQWIDWAYGHDAHQRSLDLGWG